MTHPTPPTPAFVVRAVSRTDVGMRRAANQDAVAISPNGSGGPIKGDAFLIVADGMGAHAAGELASAMAVETVPHSYLKATGESAPAALRQAIRLANEKIHGKGNSSPEFQGMGTTCSCLVLTDGAALVGHVGDSRVYRFRNRVLEQLTSDHSLVWEMAAASNVPEDKVPSCIPKNVITRSLGPHEKVLVDIEGPQALEENDVFLLCSDGLTGVVDDPMIGSLLGALEPKAAAESLVNLANLRGGPDNISVVVARIERAATGEPNPTAPTPPSKAQWNVTGAALAIACLLACVAFLSAGETMGTLASAIGFGVALAFTLASRRPLPSAPAPKTVSEFHGNGPSRRIECGDYSAAAGELRDLVNELAALQGAANSHESEEETVRPGKAPTNQEVIAEQRAQLDWGPLIDVQQDADTAFERGDYAAAIARYASILRAVMGSCDVDDDTNSYESKNEVLS